MALREPPRRDLFGPGPTNLDPRVSAALTAPLVGHLDPYFLEVMDDTMGMLRQVYRTTNHHTIPMSASVTGSTLEPVFSGRPPWCFGILASIFPSFDKATIFSS